MLGTVKTQKLSTLADKIASNNLGSSIGGNINTLTTALSVSKFQIPKHKN